MNASTRILFIVGIRTRRFYLTLAPHHAHDVSVLCPLDQEKAY